MSPFVKGFGCRPHDGVATHTGPASESLQRRKPRWGDVGRCRERADYLETIVSTGYGELMFGCAFTFNGLSVAKMTHHTI